MLVKSGNPPAPLQVPQRAVLSSGCGLQWGQRSMPMDCTLGSAGVGLRRVVGVEPGRGSNKARIWPWAFELRKPLNLQVLTLVIFEDLKSR